MNTLAWLVAGLAAADGIILVLFWFHLRPRAPFDHRSFYAIAAGLVGFVFHAFMFFSGAFLILQLATIGGLLAICRWAPSKRGDA